MFNRTSRLPVLYVFGRKSVDESRFCEEFIRCFPLHQQQSATAVPQGTGESVQGEDKKKDAAAEANGIIIFYDVCYHHQIPRLSSALEGKGYSSDRVIFTQLRSFQEAYRKEGVLTPNASVNSQGGGEGGGESIYPPPQDCQFLSSST